MGVDMLLNDKEIIRLCEDGLVTPFEPGFVNPASIDLRWSGKIKYSVSRIDELHADWVENVDCDFIYLHPFIVYMLDTIETVTMPDYIGAFLTLKSSMGRKGAVLSHAGFFDPGFTGTATFQLHIPGDYNILINKGQPIVQLVFMRLIDVPEKSYNLTGRYNGQSSPQEAK
jgi:deoxycytidine triphosphate deaminase